MAALVPTGEGEVEDRVEKHAVGSRRQNGWDSSATDGRGEPSRDHRTCPHLPKCLPHGSLPGPKFSAPPGRMSAQLQSTERGIEAAPFIVYFFLRSKQIHCTTSRYVKTKG